MIHAITYHDGLDLIAVVVPGTSSFAIVYHMSVGDAAADGEQVRDGTTLALGQTPCYLCSVMACR